MLTENATFNTLDWVHRKITINGNIRKSNTLTPNEPARWAILLEIIQALFLSTWRPI